MDDLLNIETISIMPANHGLRSIIGALRRWERRQAKKSWEV